MGSSANYKALIKELQPPEGLRRREKKRPGLSRSRASMQGGALMRGTVAGPPSAQFVRRRDRRRNGFAGRSS